MQDKQGRTRAYRLIGRLGVEQQTGLSASNIRRRERDGSFPKHINIGRRALWDADEVSEWIASQVAASRR